MPWSVGGAEGTARVPDQDRVRLGAGISRGFALRAGKSSTGTCKGVYVLAVAECE